MGQGGCLMNSLEGNGNNLYENIRNEVAKARQKVYAAVKLAMVETYWNIGKQIYEAQEKMSELNMEVGF
ncbi:MAG: hypothetical protein RBR32_13065 [Bacteroidales bacterium]|nr:hypothetical protein [Bacteroidales bacterium]